MINAKLSDSYRCLMQWKLCKVKEYAKAKALRYFGFLLRGAGQRVIYAVASDLLSKLYTNAELKTLLLTRELV